MDSELPHGATCEQLTDMFFAQMRDDGLDRQGALMSVHPTVSAAARLSLLDSQVMNGGFEQWRSNGYMADSIDGLMTLLTGAANLEIGAAPDMLDILTAYKNLVDDNLEILDLREEDGEDEAEGYRREENEITLRWYGIAREGVEKTFDEIVSRFVEVVRARAGKTRLVMA